MTEKDIQEGLELFDLDQERIQKIIQTQGHSLTRLKTFVSILITETNAKKVRNSKTLKELDDIAKVMQDQKKFLRRLEKAAS